MDGGRNGFHASNGRQVTGASRPGAPAIADPGARRFARRAASGGRALLVVGVLFVVGAVLAWPVLDADRHARPASSDHVDVAVADDDYSPAVAIPTFLAVVAGSALSFWGVVVIAAARRQRRVLASGPWRRVVGRLQTIGTDEHLKQFLWIEAPKGQLSKYWVSSRAVGLRPLQPVQLEVVGDDQIAFREPGSRWIHYAALVSVVRALPPRMLVLARANVAGRFAVRLDDGDDEGIVYEGDVTDIGPGSDIEVLWDAVEVDVADLKDQYVTLRPVGSNTRMRARWLPIWRAKGSWPSLFPW